MIENGHYYSLTAIRNLQMIPWAKHPQTLRKMVALDLANENILRALVEGAGKQKRYLVKGKYIKNYLKKYGPVLGNTVRKIKVHGKH